MLSNYRFFFQVSTGTQAFFSKVVLLLIHYITIPVGQKFIYAVFTVPLNSLENSGEFSEGVPEENF